MNQTKKRLSIIELAISMTDVETIQLQILKLSLLKADIQIQKIIGELQAENYIRAQELITTYIKNPFEKIHQKASQKNIDYLEKDTFFDMEEFSIIQEEEVEIEIEIEKHSRRCFWFLLVILLFSSVVDLVHF